MLQTGIRFCCSRATMARCYEIWDFYYAARHTTEAARECATPTAIYIRRTR
ncbi:MAG: hypothetical protein ACLR7D_05815 [Lachnospira eligens]